VNTINEIGLEILTLVDELESKLLKLNSATVTDRRNSQHRNIKQIVGHLADSASNNTHRVIHLQYQKSPCNYPDYANLGVNDKWIEIQNYNAEEWISLIQLFKFSTIHYVHVINNVDLGCLNNEWISALNQRVTLKDMIVDYPRHLKLHIGEIDQIINDG
jgi:hypothetical protein